MKLDEMIKESFSTYAGMTIQDRAIVDARDCLKPAARQCMYAQYLDKITYKNPFKKSHKSVAAALDHFYVHGDASCYALLTRLAKNFCMRYPLEDFEGSYGTISSGTSEASSRYTEMRLGELGYFLFKNIEKESVSLWYDNYDNTEKFPSVVPTLGYYNICNGTMGISTGLSSSIPQYNLREVNKALIKLLWNPDIDFDEIYCPPDFCTGATILNASIVKETHKKGEGKAIILRSTIDYNSEENCFYVTELPYSVYSETICLQIKELIESGELVGIKNVLDLSTKQANIKILLEKGVNPKRLLKQLYKKTFLQNSYTINLVMLDKGRYPKVFSWREALQAHLDHEIKTYTAIHNYEIKTIEHRIHIIDGILIAIENVDNIIQLIKDSKSKNEAKEKLMKQYHLDEEQSDAVLKITLSKFANLEILAYKDEKKELLAKKEYHLNILNNQNELYKEIEEGLRSVAEKYGDERKTKLMDLNFTNEEEPEPIEEKELLIHYTNHGNLYTSESSTLLTSKRGGKGNKVKLKENEAILETLSDNNLGTILAFSNLGKMYSAATCELPINGKINVNQLFSLSSDEKITAITTISRRQKIDYFVFVTKKGYIKKTAANEYDKHRGKSIQAIKLKDDEVISVLFLEKQPIGILTNNGNCVIINTETINPIGRNSLGVKGINLEDNDYVVAAHPVTGKYMVTVSQKGLIKKTSNDEFPLTSRATKGRKISGTKENDRIVDFLSLNENCDIIIISQERCIKINTSDLRELSRSAVGVKGIESEQVIKITIA